MMNFLTGKKLSFWSDINRERICRGLFLWMFLIALYIAPSGTIRLWRTHQHQRFQCQHQVLFCLCFSQKDNLFLLFLGSFPCSDNCSFPCTACAVVWYIVLWCGTLRCLTCYLLDVMQALEVWPWLSWLETQRTCGTHSWRLATAAEESCLESVTLLTLMSSALWRLPAASTWMGECFSPVGALFEVLSVFLVVRKLCWVVAYAPCEVGFQVFTTWFITWSCRSAYRVYYGHKKSEELGGNFLPMQHVAHAVGLAYLDEDVHLALHPKYGPWFGLRGVLVFDGVSYSGEFKNSWIWQWAW